MLISKSDIFLLNIRNECVGMCSLTGLSPIDVTNSATLWSRERAHLKVRTSILPHRHVSSLLIVLGPMCVRNALALGKRNATPTTLFAGTYQ